MLKVGDKSHFLYSDDELSKLSKELDLQLDLYRITYEFAVSGLVDQGRKHELLENCRKQLSDLSGHSNDALRLLYKVERELDLPRALVQLDKLQEQIPEEMAGWMKERVILLFHLGRYREVRENLETLERIIPIDPTQGSQLPTDPDWDSAILWWKNG